MPNAIIWHCLFISVSATPGPTYDGLSFGIVSDISYACHVLFARMVDRTVASVLGTHRTTTALEITGPPETGRIGRFAFEIDVISAGFIDCCCKPFIITEGFDESPIVRGFSIGVDMVCSRLIPYCGYSVVEVHDVDVLLFVNRLMVLNMACVVCGNPDHLDSTLILQCEQGS